VGKDGALWLFGGDGLSESASDAGYLNDLWKYDTHTHLWTWVNGSKLLDQPEIVNTIGVVDAANKPAGRSHAGAWATDDGTLWLYGGFAPPSEGVYGASTLTGLWHYYPETNQWKAEASGGTPRAEFATWKSNDGKLFMYGGYTDSSSTGNGFLTDIQRYNEITHKWDLVSRSNQPGYGKGCVAFWNDRSCNLWVFGGSSSYYGMDNELWEYVTSTDQWKEIKGSESYFFGNDQRVGTPNVPAPENLPASRVNSAAWVDTTGNFWLYGSLAHSDLWKLDFHRTAAAQDWQLFD
jgi:N-acetylneuraminic acid mutarotase